MSKLIKNSIAYLNANKQLFLAQYCNDIYEAPIKSAIFTAGMSGVGKTEFAISLREFDNNLLHIDTDAIREFFRPMGYDGQNSDLFQKASSRGFNELFSYAIKRGFSSICDSNFANSDTAVQNIERLLKKDYAIDIFYLYNYPKVCFEYAIRREVVTHRKVPKEVFLRSNENSYQTVCYIKEHFQEGVTLTLMDKRDNSIYYDIDMQTIKTIIGEDFEL